MDPAGERGADASLGQRGVEFSTGQRGVEFSTGQREAALDFALSAGARRLAFGAEVAELAEVSTGQRDVAFFDVDVSTGHREVAFFASAFAVSTGQREVAASCWAARSAAIPSTSDFGFGGVGGFAAAARDRSAFAFALFGSNRGGSVCFLT